MATAAGWQLSDATSAWCEQAERAEALPADELEARLDLVRRGIMLRRRWDLGEADAPLRARLLTLLADAENRSHRQLADYAQGSIEASTRLARRLVGEMEQDEAFLADLFHDHTRPAEAVALAVECFRDDLHWLGAMAAALEGTAGVDFLGRVLSEQESLQRVLQAWDRQTPLSSGPPRRRPPVPGDLGRLAERLRTTALSRQVEALLDRPDPADAEGWFAAWQAGSRLAVRVDQRTAASWERPLCDYRLRAADRWQQAVVGLPADGQAAAISRAAGHLADAAGEAMTFLEDLPLPEAVRSLEVLSEDTARCRAAVEDLGNRELAGVGRALRRRQRRIEGELQERRLGWRMERLFGHRAVVAFERFILLLLILFVVMLAVEGPLLEYERTRWPGSHVVEATCAWIDLGICLVFLAEFTLKTSLAQRRWLYVWRNWITGLVPAIPAGFLAYALSRFNVEMAAETFVLLRFLRYLRLPQMARWLRIARPAVRAGRLAGFLLQASDRLVRQLSPLLNRNLVLFEQSDIEIREPAFRRQLAVLRERFEHRWAETLPVLPLPVRGRLVRRRIEDLTAMLAAPHRGWAAPAAAPAAPAVREIPLERVIARLLAVTPATVSQGVDPAVIESAARWCHAFDIPLVRRLPVVRDLVAAGRRPSPHETAALASNLIGVLLRRGLDKVYWFADLYGTVTAPQLVDSIGEWMVRGTARPARRFILVGLGFLVVSYLAGLLPFGPLQSLTHTLERLIGAPLVILGIVCLVPLCLGIWFRQIAGEASDFLGQVAEAQLLAATKDLKTRFARRHHAVLHRRVIAPEQAVLGDCGNDGPDDRASAARAAVEQLWRDYLDGAPFHASDTKTTTQLLGNLMLISLRDTRLGYTRRQQKRLRRLDLAHSRSLLRGPYLWFRFISRSLAQHTARLVIDYNAHALPIARAAGASDEDVRRYAAWLRQRSGRPLDELPLPDALRRRLGALAPCEAPPAGGRDGPLRFLGADFTAICFLSNDRQLEEDVRRRYGDTVADLMRRDRRDNVRRVFRTYPLHLLPKQQRTINPLAFYEQHLHGGRVLLFPFKLAWWTARLGLRMLRLLWRFVREVLSPADAAMEAVGESDTLAVAARKVHRMRRPALLECLRMRAEFDPEYLGIMIPGCAGEVRHAAAAEIEEDLAQAGVESRTRDGFRRLAAARRRQVLELRRLLAQLDVPPMGPESMRAMTIAYTVDYHGVRSRLEAVRRLQQAFDEALGEGRPADGDSGGRWSLRAAWCRLRLGGRILRLVEQPAFAHLSQQQRAACVRLVCRRRRDLARAVRLLTRDPACLDALAAARQTLVAVGRDPATWSQQLVALRTVQTLSVLDLQTYCDLVAELGEYEPCPDDPARDFVDPNDPATL